MRARNARQRSSSRRRTAGPRPRAVDGGVLSGVTREPTEPTTKAPPRTTRTAKATPAAKAPAKATAKTPAAKATPKTPAKRTASRPAPATTAKRTAKAPAKTTTAPPAESNGSSVRESNQKLAVELVELVADHFGSASPDAKAKLAYWLHSLPTGGEGGSGTAARPKSLPRPTTADGGSRSKKLQTVAYLGAGIFPAPNRPAVRQVIERRENAYRNFMAARTRQAYVDIRRSANLAPDVPPLWLRSESCGSLARLLVAIVQILFVLPYRAIQKIRANRE